MPNLFYIKQDVFNQYELIQNQKPIRIFKMKSMAEDFRDKMNVDVLINEVMFFVYGQGSKLQANFKGLDLMKANQARQQLQMFITGCNELKRKSKATPTYVWHNLDEYILNNLGHLQGDKKPYCNAYKDMAQVALDFNTMYAPPLFEQEYKPTLSMQEFLSR